MYLYVVEVGNKIKKRLKYKISELTERHFRIFCSPFSAQITNAMEEFNQHNKQEYPPMHTLEHLINGTASRMWHCGRAVSAHIERKKSKLDFRMLQPPTDEQIRQLEATVNDIIAQNVPITYEYLTQTEAMHRFDLTRLPSDASEKVRAVRIGNFDECLCIGLHVANTSEIGRLKILSSDYDSDKQLWRMRFKIEE